MTAKPYVSQRDTRFEHATDAIEFIEQTNCAKGCIHGSPTGDPGGDCKLLALVAAGDAEPIPELIDHGRRIVCNQRDPGTSWVREVVEEVDPGGTEPLFDIREMGA